MPESAFSCELTGSPITLFQPDPTRSLFSDDVIEFGGQKFTPDESKGYFLFDVSTAFPAGKTVYGTGLHAGTIGNSWRSMLHQNLNWEHRVAAYFHKPGQPNKVDDRFIGAIVAVDYTGASWKIGDQGDTPSIKGVAVYHKLSQGMSKIIGDHQTGRHNYTVSMEVNYYPEQSGFVITKDKKAEPFKTSPNDFAKNGMDYVPWQEAPEKLRKTFSHDKNRIVARYNNSDVFLLMGGIDGKVHYGGLGLVKYGAESTARIRRMAASFPGSELCSAFETLGDALVKNLERRSKQTS